MAIYGSKRATSFTYKLEIDGVTAAIYTNVGPVMGATRNTIDVTDEEGQIHEAPGRWKYKRMSFGQPIEGSENASLLNLLKNGEEFTGSFIMRDHKGEDIATNSFDGYIVDTGLDGGDRESDSHLMANTELVIDKWR